MTKKDAFTFFGITQRCERRSWSGRTPNDDMVALTIWTDQKKFNSETKSYTTSVFDMNNEIWKDAVGNKWRIEDIKHCIENHNKKFRAIFVKPENPNIFDETRVCKDAMPFDKQWFEITKFDAQTGEFESHSLPELS
jgi:hypothetical protein